MTDDTPRETSQDAPPMEAAVYADGSITYPPHPRGPDGSEPIDSIDLSDHTARIVTWTTSNATPPGVREPNHLAIVEFEVDDLADGDSEFDGNGEPVRAIGQLTTADVSIGDEVRAVYVDELRDPDAGLREATSQEWDGYRFEPI
ncbi:MAG: Zn-ribbon domain-containing OB-fold protein [Halobacteriota archaeon]